MRAELPLDRAEVTESCARGALGVRARHAGVLIIRDALLEMEAQFVVDVGVDVGAKEPEIPPPFVGHARPSSVNPAPAPRGARA